MRVPELAQQTNTLVAIVLGAVLATLGGFVATLLEAHVRKRELQRASALMIGEVLASVRGLVRAIEDAHSRGDPFGGITLRLVRAGRREIECYERYRSVLSDLRSPDLRLSVHGVMVRLTLAIDGILEGDRRERELAYEYLLELAPTIDPLVERLVPLAGQPIQPYLALTGSLPPVV